MLLLNKETFRGHTLEKVHVAPHCYYAIYTCSACNAHGPLKILVEQLCPAKQKDGVGS